MSFNKSAKYYLCYLAKIIVHLNLDQQQTFFVKIWIWKPEDLLTIQSQFQCDDLLSIVAWLIWRQWANRHRYIIFLRRTMGGSYWDHRYIYVIIPMFFAPNVSLWKAYVLKVICSWGHALIDKKNVFFSWKMRQIWQIYQVYNYLRP